MIALERIATRHHLAIVEDACQAHLATSGGRPVGTMGVAGDSASTRQRTSARSATAAQS